MHNLYPTNKANKDEERLIHPSTGWLRLLSAHTYMHTNSRW